MNHRRSHLHAFLLAASLLLAGCGHSVEPRAPYDAAAGVPVPRRFSVRLDLLQGFVLTWSATPEDRRIVDGWILERRSTTQADFVILSGGVTRETTFVDGSLGDGVRVVYRVRAVTGAGVSSLPAESPVVRADLVPPAAPRDVAAATAPGGILVTFTRPPEDDVALYEIRLLELVSGGGLSFRTVFGTPALLAGLVAGSRYDIDLVAIDSAGRSSAYSVPAATATAGP